MGIMDHLKRTLGTEELYNDLVQRLRIGAGQNGLFSKQRRRKDGFPSTRRGAPLFSFRFMFSLG